MEFAFYQPEEGQEPSLGDYMEDLNVFVRGPIKAVHELLAYSWEAGQMDDCQDYHTAMGTLWASLLTWENINQAFRGLSLKAKGIPEHDFFPRATEEERLVRSLQVRIACLPSHLKSYMLILMHPAKDQKKIIKHLEASIKEKEGKSSKAKPKA